MTAIRNSLFKSSIDSYVSLVLQVASTVIISRLLTPAEVGIFAIAAVIHAIASTVRDFGIGEYLIQETNLTREKIRAAFGLNILMSWLMALAFLLAGPFVATFYREDGVRHVMAVMALSFLIVPFGAVLQAWFRRELNYTSIVASNVLASVATFVVAVSLASSGHGYMSLAWSGFAGMALTVVVMLCFRPRDFPRWPGFNGVAQVFHFGKSACAVYVGGQIGKGSPSLIIGRAMGSEDVGIFSRGSGIVEMFNRLVMQPVMQVCMPYFADNHRKVGTISSAYTRSVGLLTAAGWPFLAVLAAAAYPAIRIVYGNQWLHAIALAQLLCVAAIIELPFALSREALMAKGEARRARTLQMQIVLLQVLGLMAVLPFGLIGAAWGLVAASAATAAISLRHLRLGIGLHARDVVLACGPSALLTLLVVLPVVALSAYAPAGEDNFVRWAVMAAASSLVIWLIALRLLRVPLWEEVSGAATQLVGTFRRFS